MQKICFIRTLLQNPDFIFLDEATTNLDKESIEIVIQKLKSFSGTLVIVSHEPELFSSFTKEYKIKNKNLAEL